ncbi:unnamed protein product [Paramecium pentaurelia]|uniref:Transmembrane protein n=1 Tax=Paramecium pentaurelia TaxID=43138 RepID=A0A8S1VNQ6_9CILI|nr:unnamed protein product [Paramecium pentaurelia]
MEKLENHKNQTSFSSLFCLNKLKVRTQVLIIQVIIQFLIGTLLTLISYLAYQYIIDMYSNISLEFYVLQYYKKTDMITNLQVRSSQEVLLRSQTHLLKSDFLYQFIQSVELQYVQQPLNCLNYDDKLDKYQYEQTFCYGFFGDQAYPLTNKDFLAMNYSSFLTQVLPIMDMELDLLFSTIGDQMYFSIWPGDPFPNYKPHRRIWYTNHLKQIEQQNYNLTYFSDPYILWTWFLFMVTQTRNMTNLNGGLNGVLGSDLNFSLFHTLQLKQENVTFSIIDSKGQFLLSQFNISEDKYIYDTDISGYTMEDFEQINNSLYQKAFINNCSKIDQLLNNEKLCRYNSVTKTEELIVAKILDPTDLILLIQVDLLEKEKELLNQLTQIKNNFEDFFKNYILIGTSTAVFSIILSSLIIYVTLSPITNLILYTSQQITKEFDLMRQQINQKIHLKQTKYSLKTIQELHQAFRKMNIKLLNHKEGRKNITCTELEQIQFPLKPLESLSFEPSNIKNYNFQEEDLQVFYPFEYLKLHQKRKRHWYNYVSI